MRTINKLLLSLCMTIAISCAKDESEFPSVENSIELNAINEYRTTADFKFIEKLNSPEFKEPKVTFLEGQKDLKILTLPFKTENNKIRFAAIYTPKTSSFDSKSVKTLVFELKSLNDVDINKMLETRQFSGSLSIFRSDNNMLYVANFVDNKVVSSNSFVSDDIVTHGEGRGSYCTVDGIGACSGTKIDNMGFFESALCFSNVVLCVAAFAADCALENC